MSAKLARLQVVLYGRQAGLIERKNGTMTFQYERRYLDSRRPTPLSLSMPLAETAYSNRFLEAFLRGLLPDNADVRQRWARRFGLRDRDTFGLVAELGSDAAGGALFLRDDAEPLPGTLEPASEGDIAQRLRRLRADEGDWRRDDEHWSLAGAQSKFTLRRTGQGWAFAHGPEPTTHIVKPGISHIPGQALTEHVSQRAAGALGLEVAETEYVEFDGQPAIVVTRFDRMMRDGVLTRVHTEDLCQAFGIDPSRKYEEHQGKGVAEIARLLRTTSGQPAVEGFTRAVIVNHLLGAPDAHSKNYSVLLLGSTVLLAPLYDIASGLTADRDGDLRYPKGAMSIGGEREFGCVHGRHWDAFAQRVGLPAEQVREWVRQDAAALPGALADAIAGVPARSRQRAELKRVLVPRVAALCSTVTAALDKVPPARRTGPLPGRAIVKAAPSRQAAPAPPPSDGETWG